MKDGEQKKRDKNRTKSDLTYDKGTYRTLKKLYI